MKGYCTTIYAHAYGGYYAPADGVQPTFRWARLQPLDENGSPIPNEIHEISQIAPVKDLTSKAFKGHIRPNTVFQEVEIIETGSVMPMGFAVGRAYVIRKGHQLSSSELQAAARQAKSGCLVLLTAGVALIASLVFTLF